MRLASIEPLTVPGVMESLTPIARYVLAAAKAAGLDSKASYRLRLAVDELVTNTITYGYEEAGGTGDVVVRAELDEQALTFTIEDTAIPFDPRSVPGPEQIDLPLEDRPVGGLGVFLAMRGVDAFHYEYDGNRNRSILVVRRPGS